MNYVNDQVNVTWIGRLRKWMEPDRFLFDGTPGALLAALPLQNQFQGRPNGKRASETLDELCEFLSVHFPRKKPGSESLLGIYRKGV